MDYHVICNFGKPCSFFSDPILSLAVYAGCRTTSRVHDLNLWPYVNTDALIRFCFIFTYSFQHRDCVHTDPPIPFDKMQFTWSKRRRKKKNNKDSNREKEKLFQANHEKFHKDANTNYWKAISELIPMGVPALEKKGTKDREKKPSTVIVEGPKPRKPTDLSRSSHILVKLRRHAPLHLKLSPPLAAEAASAEDTAHSSTTAVPLNAAPLTTRTAAVVVA
ncbi:hypothetical protein Nepgr_028996 [Nepenthes gracilis]|uniref:Uncharacterized protein n=1 Tax=Nepenthes gracilis TaxID=150966 RepID=A0AAD3TBQ6_NEPGR|nr:hypothetical protein Nepgr_028996 [Nepenthes gracilis]